MKKAVKIALSLLSIALTVVCMVMFCFAHSGRTDKNGGHRDTENKSGLGNYHYHCGGYSAHLHDKGYCPYAYTVEATEITSSTVDDRSISSDVSTAKAIIGGSALLVVGVSFLIVKFYRKRKNII